MQLGRQGGRAVGGRCNLGGKGFPLDVVADPGVGNQLAIHPYLVPSPKNAALVDVVRGEVLGEHVAVEIVEGVEVVRAGILAVECLGGLLIEQDLAAVLLEEIPAVLLDDLDGGLGNRHRGEGDERRGPKEGGPKQQRHHGKDRKGERRSG